MDVDKAPVLGPNQKLDMSSLRYPGENLFLAVIIVFNVIVFLIGGLIALAWVAEFGLGVVVPVVFFGGGIYVFYKIGFVFLYWHIFGNSVQISPTQYPEVHEAVKKACKYIDLRPLPKVFVFHGEGLLELFLVKRFTKRGILIFTAELIETLLYSGDSRQLMMIVGRQLGHLKAGHYKGWFFKDFIGTFTFWIHKAWWRRCHYTADRVGFLVAGSLEASRQGLLAITVGKRLAQATNMDAIHEQDAELKTGFFPQLVNLFSTYPYMMSRITELESYSAYVVEHPVDATAEHAVAMLPTDVSRFQVIVKGNAIFGDQGLIQVAPAAGI